MPSQMTDKRARQSEIASVASAVDQAFEAARSNDWERANSLLAALDEQGNNLPASALELLALSSFRKAGTVSDACKFMERAFAAFVEEGNKGAAVMCATHLVGLF